MSDKAQHTPRRRMPTHREQRRRERADLLAQVERLTAAILAAHPAGQDPDADPLEVLKMLGNEWVEMTMAPMPAKVSFLDGETEREAVWEDGDESVGIRGGYTTEDDLVERLTEQRDGLAAACREFVRKVDVGEARSVRSYAQMKSALAALKGEDDG